MTKGEAIEVFKEDLEILNSFDNLYVNKQRERMKEVITYALAVLERVKVETIEKVLKESSIVKSCEGIGGIELEVEKLSQAIVKELTGEVGK